MLGVCMARSLSFPKYSHPNAHGNTDDSSRRGDDGNDMLGRQAFIGLLCVARTLIRIDGIDILQ